MNSFNKIGDDFKPQSMVGELLVGSGRNEVDEYLDDLDGPTENELNNMVVENDLEDEDLE